MLVNEIPTSKNPEPALQSSDPRLFAKAAEAFQHRRYDDAERDFKKILRKEPSHFGALSLYAVLLMQSGRLEEAESSLRRAARINAKSDVAFYNHGLVLKSLKRPQEALAAFGQSIAINPASPESWNNRGTVLNDLGRYDEAIKDFDQAISLAATYGGAVYNKGKAFLMSQRYDEALATFDRAAKIDPNLAEVWVGRGNVYAKIGRESDAVAAFLQAIKLNPNLSEAWNGAGWALKTLGRHEEALAAFKTAREKKPDTPFVKGEILSTKAYLCDWTGLADESADCIADINAGIPAIYPFAGLSLPTSSAEQFACASAFSKHTFRDAIAPLWRGECYTHDRIRVAYVSGDFREHAVAYLSGGVFEHHDREQFETFGVSLGVDDGSATRARMTQAFDHFIDARSMSDREVANLLREMEADIVIDLMGHTANARLAVLAWRPAPVQATYLGYAGTTGTNFIDYIIADPTVIPAHQQQFYSEKVASLPDCYLPNDRARAIAEAPSRQDAHLPDNGFVFCSFNNAYKISPAIFDVWMRLLGRVGGSVLWLSSLSETAHTNLRKEAEQRGIAADRIIFADRTARQDDHLARLRLADLFLDTLHYNAHTTACDALWAGVPLLTCSGSTFAGRVGASILKAVGLPELVAASLEDYEALAEKLAKDPALLGSIRTRLAAQRMTAPLFDTERFTRQLETVYRTMWQRAQNGEPPTALPVSPALSGH